MALFDKLARWLTGKPQPVEEAASEASAGEPEVVADVARERPEHRWTAKDDAELEARARALFASGNAADALKLLSGANLLARHESTRLPCLCAKCLKPAPDSPEVDGVRYVRDFVVARYRVLFYWTPEELAGDAKQVRASMRSSLRAQLRTRPRPPGAPRTNPFTGRSMS